MNTNLRKLTLAAVLVAVCVACAPLSIPVGASKCFPIQHLVNILAGVFLGPWYGVGMAFCTSLIRVLTGTGTLLAFPGSMCGALLCGLVYWKSKNLPATLAAEVFGTGIIGGLAAYPVAKGLMGLTPAAYTVYIVPFLISTVAGSILAGILVFALEKSGAVKSMRASLEH